MNGFRTKYSTAATAALLVGLLAAGAGVAATKPPASVSPVTASALAEAGNANTAPTFAAIPLAPTDIRGFRAWRGAIADLKAVGAQTDADGKAGPWLLDGTEAWAEHERAEADPPAPMTTPADGDTAAFVREMIRRATPPPRAH
jgi:hypothetical protein